MLLHVGLNNIWFRYRLVLKMTTNMNVSHTNEYQKIICDYVAEHRGFTNTCTRGDMLQYNLCFPDLTISKFVHIPALQVPVQKQYFQFREDSVSVAVNKIY